MNEQNLIPQAHKLTVEEASRGGKKSGEKRRQMRLMRECAEILMSKEYTNSQGQKMDGTMIAMTKQFQKMLDGDIKALEFFRDITGQKPAERIEVGNIPKETYERVMSVLEEED
jgi:hypothetical protein